MISKKKVEGEMNGSSSHQQQAVQQQVYQHSQMPSQQQQYQQQQQQQQIHNFSQKSIEQNQMAQLQHQQHIQQHQQNRQNMKSNSLSMSVIVSPNSNTNQIPNLHPNQCIQSPSNANPSIVISNANSLQKNSPQQIQQLSNKAFSLIKNNYFKPNAAGMPQTSSGMSQQQYLSSPTGQINSPSSNQQAQSQNQISQLNNSQVSGGNVVSNKKSPKISNHSHQNNGNTIKGSSSGQNMNASQKEGGLINKEQMQGEVCHNGGIAFTNTSTAQKSHSNLPQSIDKTTHLQNLDKIRSNLNSKLQIQTELNAIVVGGNSLSNLGLICNQGAIGNIYSQLPSSTTNANATMNGSSGNSFQNQNQTFKKILSITPQYASSSKIKLFESQNKQLHDFALKQKKEGTGSNSVQQVSASSSMQVIQQAIGKLSQNKLELDEDDSNQMYKNEEEQEQQEDESDTFNENGGDKVSQNQEINNIIGNHSAIEDYSKNSQHKQSDLDSLNLAATLMFDKLKKRDKNPNSAKGHPRNAYQSGLTSNASYSKSSLPSNNSTTVNHYQGSNSNFNQNQQNQSLNKNGLLPQQIIAPNNAQPATFLSNSINNMTNKNIFGFTSNNGTGTNPVQSSQNSKNQLSKTLSFTLQQYNQLMNHDLHQLQQQQQQPQNLMKQIHSQTTNQQNEILNQVNVNYPLNLPQVNSSTNILNQQNHLASNVNNSSIKSPSQQLHTTQKHRKVVSMSSSSPKYSKENMYIDCSKGSYNIVDVKKLFKGISPSTSTNFHILSNNQITTNKQTKQLGSGEKGEANFCTPHNHQNQSVQQGDKQGHLQIKFSKTPGNMSFNHSSNNNNNVQNIENSREVEKQNKNQDKSKNFLSKITNQGNKSNQIEETSSKKQHQKKSHKSQSCIAVTSSNQNQQKVSGNIINQAKEDTKKIPQITIQHIANDTLYNKNRGVYQSQTDFSLLKQQLMEQQNLINQMHEKNQLQQQQQHHISCDETTAVNSNAKEKTPELEQLHLNSQEQYLKLENGRIASKFDQILKQRIDENSYSEIMDVFAQLASSDVYFSQSLSKLKICLDSLMHDMNGKIKNLKIFAAKTQQLKKSVETINNEKKQLQNKVNILQNENQQLLSNSTNVTNSNQSKTNNNINMPSDCCNNTNFNRPQNFSNGQSPSNQNDYNVNLGSQNQEDTQQYKKPSAKYGSTAGQKEMSHFQEKQTQTALKENDSTEKQKLQMQQQVNNNLVVQKDEIDEAVNENQILRGYIVEQEKKLTAYKEKESSMIKLLLAIKKNGIDIDEIYERDVVNQITHHKNQQNQNNNNNDEDDDNQDETDENFQGNHLIKSRYIENIKNGIVDQRNRSQSLGFADESIINDSDESSFNYFGKPSSLDDSMLSQIEQPTKGMSNMNSGRSKIEEGIKKKLRLNLNDLKKVTTQPNEDGGQNNQVNNEQVQQQQQMKQQNQQINEIHQHQSPKPMQNIIHNDQNVNQNHQFMNHHHKGMKNQNIFIEQEYQECNFDKNQNKRLISPNQQQIEGQEEYDENNNDQQFFQSMENQNLLQDYIFNPQMKASSNNYKDMNDFTSQSDYQNHKVDSQIQNNFDVEDDHLQGDGEENSSMLINQNQIDSQNELMKKLDDISLTWPDDNKPVVF